MSYLSIKPYFPNCKYQWDIQVMFKNNTCVKDLPINLAKRPYAIKIVVNAFLFSTLLFNMYIIFSSFCLVYIVSLFSFGNSIFYSRRLWVWGEFRIVMMEKPHMKGINPIYPSLAPTLTSPDVFIWNINNKI